MKCNIVFDGITLENRWSKNHRHPDWTIIGISKKYVAKNVFCFKFSFFGIDLSIWFVIQKQKNDYFKKIFIYFILRPIIIIICWAILFSLIAGTTNLSQWKLYIKIISVLILFLAFSINSELYEKTKNK